MPNRNVPFPNPLISGPEGSKNRRLLIIIGVCWLIISNILMSFLGSEAKTFTAETQGTVEKYELHEGRGRHSPNDTCNLTISFSVNDKNYYGKALGGSTSDCKFKTGSEVNVSYKPDNPEQFMTTVDKNGGKAIFFLNNFIGILFVGLGVFGIFWQRPAFAAKVKSIFKRS